MNNLSHYLIVSGLLAGAANGQSLFVQSLDETRQLSAQDLQESDGAQASMLYVAPPEPRDYAKHDLVTIIIDENSKQTSSQTLDTKRKAISSIDLDALTDPWELLELRLREGALSNQSLLDMSINNKYKAEGDYERSDRFNAKITAEIIEVKPNGTLVLQATKQITKDEEIQTLVLSGIIRQEDITNGNTILSTQMANLSLTVQNEGSVRDAAKKGFLMRALDTIFNF
jgi:flagellar L-ring protein FlgH